MLKRKTNLSMLSFLMIVLMAVNGSAITAMADDLSAGEYSVERNDSLYKIASSQLDLYSETAGKFSDVYKFKHTEVLNLDKHLEKGKFNGSQKEYMERFGFVAIIKAEDYHENYIDTFIEDYQNHKIEEKPVIIYSMWKGYLQEDNKSRNESRIKFFSRQEKKGIEVVYDLHTSGHATPEMLAMVIKAVAPRDKIYPMHTECADEFKKLNIGEYGDRL